MTTPTSPHTLVNEDGINLDTCIYGGIVEALNDCMPHTPYTKILNLADIMAEAATTALEGAQH